MRKKKISKSEIESSFETEMFDNGDTNVLAKWESLLHVQMFIKRNLNRFLWMDNLYCVYMYIILWVSVTQVSFQGVHLMMVICLFVLWWKVCMCVVSLRPFCFSICKFWHLLKTWQRTCTCLILNIFCSPVVSMKSHLSLTTNKNVWIL